MSVSLRVFTDRRIIQPLPELPLIMPEITVIVPVFNSEAYLEDCIKSVLDQSFADWELLLIDDGSIDKSNEICSSFVARDNRIKLIVKSNEGVSAARNAGLEYAQGKYVIFLDADDELYDDALSSLYDIAEKTDSLMTIGGYVYGSEKPESSRSKGEVRLVDSRQLCIDSLYQKQGTDTSVCWRLFRKTIFNGLRFYDGRYEDLEIFHKLLMRTARVAVTGRLIYFYRRHPSSFINSWSEQRKDIVRVTQSIVRAYGSDKDLNRAALNRHFSANYNLLLALLRYCPERRSDITECMKIIASLRKTILDNPHSRWKDRFGGLVSYFGLRVIRYLS